jgi:hypothetical protein
MACEILIANPIDWLFAACLEYFIFFSIDSSEARKQYDEYCRSIMQTITYAHDRTLISINENNWFVESRFFVGIHWMEFADTTLGISEQYLFVCHQTGMVGH